MVQSRINIVTGSDNSIVLYQKRTRDNCSKPIQFNNAREEIMLGESTESKR